MQRHVGYARERRAEKNRVAFKALVDAPAAGALAMPAGARVLLRSVAGCAAGTAAGTVGSRAFTAPLLAAGGTLSVGYVERAVVVTPAAGFDILIDMGLGRLSKVGGA